VNAWLKGDGLADPKLILAHVVRDDQQNNNEDPKQRSGRMETPPSDSASHVSRLPGAEERESRCYRYDTPEHPRVNWVKPTKKGKHGKTSPFCLPREAPRR
jgi:hypothetical protein